MHAFAQPKNAAARRSAIVALLVSIGMAGCSPHVDDMNASAPIPDDYHLRHPIILTEAPDRLDVFLTGVDGRLDERQTDDLRRFALEYRNNGRGSIEAMLPEGSDRRSVRATLDAIKKQLAKAGVRGSMRIGDYPVSDEHLAAVVRLSFSELQASVPSRCGQWPDDLASGSSIDGMANKTYSNFGCATQTDLAMQVADPRDLVRPRAETPADSAMRLRAIGNIEQGVDPGTAWTNNNTSISTVGSN